MSLGGNFGLFENNIEATASLGPLALKAELVATVDEATGKFFAADATFSLVNPVDGAGRVYINDIVDADRRRPVLLRCRRQSRRSLNPSGFIDGVRFRRAGAAARPDA